MRITKALVLSSLLSLVAVASAASVEKLRCEYLENPLGLHETQPRLSWVMDSSRRGERQTAYQILVATSARALAQEQGELWDSGKVASDETAQIVYGGKPLASRQSCFWKVRVWDATGHVGDWSRPARWEMGLLDLADWQAEWIKGALPGEAAEDHDLTGANWIWSPWVSNNPPAGVRYFRHEFTLPAAKLETARVLISVDDHYTLLVNGQVVGSNASKDGWRRIRSYDVGAALQPGLNVLAVAATNIEGHAGLCSKLVWRLAGESSRSVVSGAEWKTSESALEGWATTSVDASAWQPAKVIAAAGQGHWGKLKLDGPTAHVPVLRKEVELPGKSIASARLYATALGLYELHLNGRRVGDYVLAPEWTDYRKRIRYQAYDVTPLLNKGANVLTAQLGHGWYSGVIGNGEFQFYGKTPALLAQLEVTFTDGSRQCIVTDDSWKAHQSPIVSSDFMLGETYDATREIPRLHRPGLDLSSWLPVSVRTAPDCPLEGQVMEPSRYVTTLKALSLTESSPDHWVFDLGQNLVGVVQLKVKAPAGTRLTLRHAEMLNPDGTIYLTNLRGAPSVDHYICKGGGTEEWHPTFAFHGFRYVELTGLPGKPSLGAVSALVISSDTPQAGSFTCSDPRLNQLQSNIEWGQRGNYLSVPTDCPQRDERLGWMGDAQVFIRTATYNADVAAFFTKWLVDVDDGQSPEGSFADVNPNTMNCFSVPAWGDAGVICPWTIYQVYGDRRVLEQHLPAMTKWVEWCRTHSTDLIRDKDRGNDYGDWLSINADTPKDLLGTAYFAYSTRLLGQSCAAVGRTEEAAQYEQLFQDIKQAFIAKFVDDRGHVKGETQSGYLMALKFDLLPAELRASAAQYLEDDIRAKASHLSTGFVGVSYLLPTLTRADKLDTAYQLLMQDTFPSWLFSVKQGATTIWERWDGWTPEKGFQDPGMNSFNHYSLGSCGEWLYGTVAGIGMDPAQPGFKQIVIRPRPGGGLTEARAHYDSIHGRIVSSWMLKERQLMMDVTIPANTTATVWVPTTYAASVRESGRPMENVRGVKFLRAEPGVAVYEVGAGRYHFSSLLAQ